MEQISAKVLSFPVLDNSAWNPSQGGPALMPRQVTDRDRKPLVVIAEDNRLQRGLLCAFLESEQFHVVTCRDGERALHFCQEAGHIDLLLSDVNMPYMDGDRLAAAVLCNRPSLPVILMSSEPPSMRSHAMLAGRNWTFLQKPYTLPSLLALARQTLAKSVSRERLIPSGEQAKTVSICKAGSGH